MRSPLPAGRAGSDRWLLSYADLMTLLFAFSMTLYAARGADLPRADALPHMRATLAAAPTAAVEMPALSALPAAAADTALAQRLARELAGALGSRRVELIRDTRGLVVSMPDDAAFSTGSAEATAETRRLIARVGDTLRDVPNAIRIEGHTDNVPIKTPKYDSNWELSTARASAVVALLLGVGIDAGRLSAAGYGEYHPLNANDTEAHRARNRRVDLVILDLPPGSTPPVAPESGGTRAAP